MLITGSDQTNPINNNANFDLLTLDEVAVILKVDPTTVGRSVRRGEIAAVKWGRSVRIRRQDLEEFITKHLKNRE